MDNLEAKNILINPKVNPEEFCKISLCDLILSQKETNDFAKFLVVNWKRLYNKSNFVMQKDESNAKVVQLIDDKYRDITISINIARSGNINIYITSLNGYCCRKRNKNVSARLVI